MSTYAKAALTPLDLCTFIAHETVSLLITDAEALDTAAQLRAGLDILAAENGLAEEAAPLLTWIDQEMESAREFTVSGQDAPHLIASNRLVPVPDAAAQMQAVWALFQTAVCSAREQRRTLFETAKALTEMGGMEDMLLDIQNPTAAVLKAEDLRAEIADVRTALRAEQAHSPSAKALEMEAA